MVATGGGWGMGSWEEGGGRGGYVRVGWVDMGSSGEKVAAPRTPNMI